MLVRPGLFCPALTLNTPVVLTFDMPPTLYRETGEQSVQGVRGCFTQTCCDWAVIGSLSPLYPFISTSVSFNLVAHCVFYSLRHSFSYTASHSLVHLRKSVVVKSLLSS